MSILAGVRSELDHTCRLWRGHVRLIGLFESMEAAPNCASAAVIAEQLADRLESQAEHLESSRLARATTALPTPAEMRAQAASWREQAERLWTAAFQGRTS